MALDFDKLRKQYEDSKSKRRSGGNGDLEFWKPEDGRNVIRVLPSKTDDANEFYSEVPTNFNLGPKGDKAALSRKYTGHDDDPVQEYMEELYASGDKDDKSLADKMKTRTQYYFNVLDRSLEPGDDNYGKPMILRAGQTIYDGILDLILDPDYGNIMDEKEGYDVIIKKSGKGKKTEYTVTAKPKQLPIVREEDEDFDWETSLYDLKAFSKPKSYDDIAYLMDNGEWPSSGDDDDEEEKPKKSPKREKATKTSEKKRRPAPKEEEEDDDDDYDDDDDDELEKEIAEALK